MLARIKKLSVLLILSSLTSCAAPKTTIKVLKPSVIDMSDFKRIAVADFRGKENSGAQAASILISKLFETKAFDIVERQNMERILKEHSFNMTGAVDESTAKELGSILGVDALIFGEVNTYGVEDKEGQEKVKKEVWTGEYEKDKQGNYVYEKTLLGGKQKKKIYKEEFVEEPFVVRTGGVSINFRVVDIKSGKIIATETHSETYKDKASGADEIGGLSSKGEILSKLTNQATDKFVKQIASYYATITRQFEKKSKQSEQGIKLAQAGLWEQALKIFLEETNNNMSKAYTHYNLGVAYESMGKLDLAKGEYEKAVSIESKDLYIKAISEVKKQLEDLMILRERAK